MGRLSRMDPASSLLPLLLPTAVWTGEASRRRWQPRTLPKEDDTSERDDTGGRGYPEGRFASPARLGPGPDSLDKLARRLWSVHGIPALSVTTVLDSLKAHEDMIQRIN